MRTIEYKKLMVSNSKKIVMKGKKDSLLNMYSHARKHLKEMDLEDPFNKKIVDKYLEYLSKKERLNRKERVWLVEYIAITEAIKNDIDFDIVNRIPIRVTPNYSLFIGPGIEFRKDENDLGINTRECDSKGNLKENRIGINLSYIKKFKENENDDDFYNILVTCYHEITHSVQNKTMAESKYPNFEVLMLVLEQLLLDYDKNYYEHNYDRLLSENQAEMLAIEKSLILLHDCNDKKYNEIFKIQKKEFQKYKRNMKTFITGEIVTYNLGEVTSLKIVDELMKKYPDLLDEYPCLKYVYDLEGNHKSIKRLINDEKTCLDLYTKIYSDDKKKISDTKELYDHLIWVRLLDEKNYDKYSEEEISRITECLSAMKINIKERKCANRKFDEIELYDVKKNDIIFNKNLIICDELLKNISYSNIFSDNLKQ